MILSNIFLLLLYLKFYENTTAALPLFFFLPDNTIKMVFFSLYPTFMLPLYSLPCSFQFPRFISFFSTSHPLSLPFTVTFSTHRTNVAFLTFSIEMLIICIQNIPFCPSLYCQPVIFADGIPKRKAHTIITIIPSPSCCIVFTFALHAIYLTEKRAVRYL